jgi:mannobiose 2-epimerase
MTPETRSSEPSTTDAETAARRARADELDAYLLRHVVEPHFPANIDTDGWGFRSRFDADWKPLPDPTRYTVFQSRVAWTAAFLLDRRPALAERLLPVARHGLEALHAPIWDEQHGGYFHRVELDGRPQPESGEKDLYDQAFALQALTRLSRAPGDGIDRRRAADRLEQTLDWIETRHRRHDAPAYRSRVARDGSPLPFDPAAVAPPSNGFEGPVGWHDFNSHLHLLSAFSTLHQSTSTPEMAERVDVLIDLLAGPFWAEPGCFHILLDAELRPVPGPVSFGHDVEAAWMILEAAERIGRGDESALRDRMVRLAEHGLAFGWDPHLGAWTERGEALRRSRDLTLGWWVAFEALNTFSAFADRFANKRRLFERAFDDTWRFIGNRLTDHESGGIWLGFDSRGHLRREKSGPWFATYHAARTLVEAADRLRGAGP